MQGHRSFRVPRNGQSTGIDIALNVQNALLRGENIAIMFFCWSGSSNHLRDMRGHARTVPSYAPARS